MATTRSLPAITTWLLLSLCASLAACGWHLRGNINLTDEQRNVQLVMKTNRPELSRALIKSFALFKVDLSTSATAAPYRLLLTDAELERRNASLASGGGIDSISLTLEVIYSIIDQYGQIIVLEGPARVERNYLYDPNQVASKAEEEATIIDEMYQQLALQILNSFRYGLLRTEREQQAGDSAAPVVSDQLNTPIPEPVNAQDSSSSVQ